MEKEIIDSAIIDPNLDSYEQFFDHDWCKRIFELVESFPLKAAVDTLVLACARRTAYTDCLGSWLNN